MTVRTELPLTTKETQANKFMTKIRQTMELRELKLRNYGFQRFADYSHLGCKLSHKTKLLYVRTIMNDFIVQISVCHALIANKQQK